MDYRPGEDIFDAGADLIVNPVNCQAHHLKPGRQMGLAGAFEKRFPGIQEPFRRACSKGQMKPGSVQIIGVDRESGERAAPGAANLLVANVATKDHWRDPSRIEWVDRGLEKLAGAVEKRGIRSVAIPMLGAGFGKLSWEEVRNRVDHHFRPLSEKGVSVMVMGEGPDRDAQMAEAVREKAAPAERPTPSPGAKRDPWPEGTRFYAGIGARDTPEPVQEKMRKIGRALAERGVVLRSGAAAGADSAFEKGAEEGDASRKEIYLPWAGFNDRQADGKTVFAENSSRHEEIAAEHHPAWGRLKRGARSMMARNASQMQGRDLDRPSDMIICWTRNGEAVGGTGQSIRMAEKSGIPVINLGEARFRTLPADSVVRVALDVAEGKKLGRALTQEKARRRREDEGR